ncbi:probable F-box protein At4g22030 [Carica papaya]|uniref:probable F-box protein At4g22030 n=1 Tax=Carica papaya TaxID=3649 RepID=UPI000B8CF955|nr:probable F-box protein At4g22030 [Carica papaya]
MASLQASSTLLFSSSSRRLANAAISVPKLPKINKVSVPKIQTRSKLVEELTNGFVKTIIPLERTDVNTYNSEEGQTASMEIRAQLHAILEAVADRIEMHNNIGEQRDNWNSLLLNSINMITLSAATIAAIAASANPVGASLLACKFSSTLMFSAATGMLVIMNKIQPSQLVEEQRNATRLFKQLQRRIETILSLGNPTEEDVKDSMKRVLALDRAYPLPLLGVMLEKFPNKFKPATWWPKAMIPDSLSPKKLQGVNGWTEELETEMKELLQVIKRNDSEDYERLGNIALKVNRTLAISGPTLTAVAALASAFLGNPSNGWWPSVVVLTSAAMAAIVNSLEHGGQVGMVFEMYRNSAGFFSDLQESIESTVSESNAEKRENGELFEMKMALKLGRSLSELRDLARKSSLRVEGSAIDEFASKLF